MKKIDVGAEFQLIRDVFSELHGAEPPETTVQAIAALARHESGFGTYKPFYRAATADSPEFEAHNYGAIQCSKPADKNGQCGDGCFPAKDTSPTPGGQVAYVACFKVYPDDRAGCLDLVKLVTKARPGIAAQLPTGDVTKIAKAMYEAEYYEGFGPTPEARIAGYATALLRNGDINAKAAGVELRLIRTELVPDAPPGTPPGTAPSSGAAEAAGATFFALLFAALMGRILGKRQ